MSSLGVQPLRGGAHLPSRRAAWTWGTRAAGREDGPPVLATQVCPRLALGGPRGTSAEWAHGPRTERPWRSRKWGTEHRAAHPSSPGCLGITGPEKPPSAGTSGCSARSWWRSWEITRGSQGPPGLSAPPWHFSDELTPAREGEGLKTRTCLSAQSPSRVCAGPAQAAHQKVPCSLELTALVVGGEEIHLESPPS